MTRGRCGSLIHFRMTFAFTTPRRFNRRTRSPLMKTIFYAFGALLLVSAVTVLYKTTAAADRRVSSVTVSHRPELEYLKAVNSVAPPQDPQLLFLLMAEYANANLQSEGAEFFSARLKEFGPRLTDVQKALYLSAIGLLRAQNASSVSLWH